MAIQYVTKDNLVRYDNLVKMYIDTQTVSSIKTVTYDSQTNKLSFYKIDQPIPSGTTPYLEVSLGMPDGITLQEALDNLTVGLVEQQTPDQGMFKTYVLKQGLGTFETEVGKFSLPYDTVVQGGSVVTATTENPIIIDGQTVTEGKFLQLNIAHQTDPVYISFSDIGAVYTDGDGINIDSNAEISVVINSNKANGLAVTSNGIELNLATPSDESNSIQGSAGAMSVADKDKLDSIRIATDAEILALFD